MRMSNVQEALLRGRAVIAALDADLAVPIPELPANEREAPLTPAQRAELTRTAEELRETIAALRGDHVTAVQSVAAWTERLATAREEGRSDLASQAEVRRDEARVHAAALAEELSATQACLARAEGRLLGGRANGD